MTTETISASSVPNEFPNMVNLVPPLIGPFEGSTSVMYGAMKMDKY